MTKEECERRAVRALRIADESAVTSAQSFWRNMAEYWLRLAEDAPWT